MLKFADIGIYRYCNKFVVLRNENIFYSTMIE